MDRHPGPMWRTLTVGTMALALLAGLLTLRPAAAKVIQIAPFPPPLSLTQAVAQGLCKTRIAGDGVSTDVVKLTVINLSDQTLDITLERLTCFTPPADGDLQAMMAAEESQIAVPARHQATVAIPTLCAGLRTQHPPPVAGYACVPGPLADAGAETLIQSVAYACDGLAQEKAFEQCPVQPDTVKQLAIWQALAWYTGRQDALVTIDFLHQEVAAQLRSKERDLPPKEHKELQDGSKTIMESVDLTLKRAGVKPP